jgi:hypothetical protein
MKKDLADSTSAIGKDLANSKTANSTGAILYNNIDCGGINATPQSQNEEKQNQPIEEFKEDDFV